MTFDGFKSYVNANATPQDFADVKIRAVKEKNGTSYTNQLYDQAHVETEMRNSRQMAQSKVKGSIYQWKVIGILTNLKDDV